MNFLIEHNFPLITADHVAKLFRNMLPDSEMVNQYRCGRTSTTHMLAGPVAKQITGNLKEELLLTFWYGLAKDGSSGEDDKFLSFSVRRFDKDSGLISISLVDMPNINWLNSTANVCTMCVQCVQ